MDSLVGASLGESFQVIWGIILPRKNPVRIKAVAFLPGEYLILARS